MKIAITLTIKGRGLTVEQCQEIADEVYGNFWYTVGVINATEQEGFAAFEDPALRVEVRGKMLQRDLMELLADLRDNDIPSFNEYDMDVITNFSAVVIISDDDDEDEETLGETLTEEDGERHIDERESSRLDLDIADDDEEGDQ